MKIGDKCIFKGTKGDAKCVILDKEVRKGSSIQNDSMQTMDLVITTYYKINYLDKDIWVTDNFLIKDE